MLAAPCLGDHCFLLHTFSKTPKKRFEAFTLIDSYFYQDAPGISLALTHKVYGPPNLGSIWGTLNDRGSFTPGNSISSFPGPRSLVQKVPFMLVRMYVVYSTGGLGGLALQIPRLRSERLQLRGLERRSIGFGINPFSHIKTETARKDGLDPTAEEIGVVTREYQMRQRSLDLDGADQTSLDQLASGLLARSVREFSRRTCAHSRTSVTVISTTTATVLVPSLAWIVSEYDAVVSWSSSPATVIAPVPASIANLPSSLPAVIE